MKQGKQGFTLIEVLIVIAIIGILASVILVGLGPIQRQGRDSRRISDLRQVQHALELYYQRCGFYPGPGASTCTTSGFSDPGNDWAVLSSALIDGGVLGVGQIPRDPTSGLTYQYSVAVGGVSYTIGAYLEDSNNPALRDSGPGSIGGVNCGSQGSAAYAGRALYCVAL